MWLDLSKARVMRQVARRTDRRRLGRQVLGNGNIESPLTVSISASTSCAGRGLRTPNFQRVAALRQQRPELITVMLRDWGEAQQWLDDAAAAEG